MNRRSFLQFGLIGLYCPSQLISLNANAKTEQVTKQFLMDEASLPIVSASFNKKARGFDYFVSWFSEQSKSRIDLPIPFRAHDILIHPNKKNTLIVMGRRPGTKFCEINMSKQMIVELIECEPNKHLYGHACISPDGMKLLTTENYYKTGQGRIVIRNLEDYKKINEFDSYGIGPHDLKLLSDNQTLVIANGGIKTHPDFYRKKLNLDTMQPNLSYIDINNGQLKQQLMLDDHQSSIRHLAISKKNTVVIGLQYQGARKRAKHMIALHLPNNNQLIFPECDQDTIERMNYYTASVAVNQRGTVAAVTSPKGNLVTFWDLDNTKLIHSLDLLKPFGVVFNKLEQAFYISTDRGQIIAVDSMNFKIIRNVKIPRQWDNHMIGLV